MKKLIGAILAILLLASPCFAAQVLTTAIAETALTKSASETKATIYTGDTEKLVVFVDYDANSNEPLDISFDVSYDGTNWLDAKFYDYTGGATLQTSEQLTADGWYYAYWIDELSPPYVRIHTIGNTWSSGSTATVTVYTAEQK